MGRHRKFQTAHVLEKAMLVFWTKGYECASMRDLGVAMGINPSSIYLTFGDKRGLYLAVLDYFYDNEITKMLAPLEGSGSHKQAIREVFLAVAEEAALDGECRGCMMYNTAVELCPQDHEVTAKVAAGLKRTEDAFFSGVVEAQAQGEIPSDYDPRNLARFLSSSLSGLGVMGRVFQDPGTLRDIVDTSLSILD